MIYYGEIEYTSGYLGCQDVRERERVTVELRGTVGPYINNWLILHLVTGAGFVLPTVPLKSSSVHWNLITLTR